MISNLNGVTSSVISNTLDVGTSNTSLTFLFSRVVYANTFKEGDFISFDGMFDRQNGVLGTMVARLYINTADATLTGAIQVGTRTMTTSDNFCYLSRKLFIANATGGGTGNSVGTQVISSVSNLDDYQSGIRTNLAIDWTIDQYLILAGFVTNSGDFINANSLTVYKF